MYHLAFLQRAEAFLGYTRQSEVVGVPSITHAKGNRRKQSDKTVVLLSKYSYVRSRHCCLLNLFLTSGLLFKKL